MCVVVVTVCISKSFCDGFKSRNYQSDATKSREIHCSHVNQSCSLPTDIGCGHFSQDFLHKNITVD